jgi:predicted nucleotidyltransferase
MTITIPPEIETFARTIADRLTQVPRVRAVVLGGSWVRGGADPNSDIDLGIYYHGAEPPPVDDLRALAAELDDLHRGEAVTDFGAWGPWINGGAWLTIQGRRVDWLYRDLRRVHDVLESCLAGKPAAIYQAGHPHAFHTPIYLGEAVLCMPLTDPYGDLARLKAQLNPYPLVLHRAMIEGGLWEAQFTLDTTQKPALRGDVLVVAGGLFRCVADLVQVLFALNERWCLNEKGALRQTRLMPHCPPDFAEHAERMLSGIGSQPAELQTSLTAAQALLTQVRALCQAQGFAL